jgi:hypothetical protein
MAYDEARLIEALKAADAAGDEAAARQIVGIIQASRNAPAPAAPAAPEEPGMLGKIGNMFSGADRQTRATQELPELPYSGILAGIEMPAMKKEQITAAIALTTDANEIAQILKSAAPDIIGIQQDEKGNILVANNSTGARAVVNAPGFSTMDAINTGAIGAAYTPSGRALAAPAGILKTAAVIGGRSAATQTGIEGLQASAGGDFNSGEVALAGVAGAAPSALFGAAGAAVDAGKRVVGAARGTLDDPLVAAARKADIPLMTSDVVEPSTYIGNSARALGERIPYAGTGGVRATQQAARERAVQELGERYPVPNPSRIVEGLKASRDRVKNAAGKRYEELVPQVDQMGAVRYDKTADAIQEATDRLTTPGVVSSNEALSELQAFAQTLSSADQTFSTLKQNRTALREIIDSFDGAARSQMPSRDKASLNRVYSAMSQDMDDAARNALSPRDFARLKEADAIYRAEAQNLTKSRLKTVLDKGDITPETAELLVFSNKPSEVRNLYNSLNTDGRQAMRATIINRAVTKAGGIENISPDKFLNEITRLQSQTGIAFKGDERMQVEGLRQVLQATKRAGQAGVFANTGAQNFAPVAAAGAGAFFGDFGTTLAAGGTVGVMARAYEAPLVRNALIRIGKQPKTEASKRLALDLARALNAGVQSARAQATEEPEQPQNTQGQR